MILVAYNITCASTTQESLNFYNHSNNYNYSNNYSNNYDNSYDNNHNTFVQQTEYYNKSSFQCNIFNEAIPSDINNNQIPDSSTFAINNYSTSDELMDISYSDVLDVLDVNISISNDYHTSIQKRPTININYDDSLDAYLLGPTTSTTEQMRGTPSSNPLKSDNLSYSSPYKSQTYTYAESTSTNTSSTAPLSFANILDIYSSYIQSY